MDIPVVLESENMREFANTVESKQDNPKSPIFMLHVNFQGYTLKSQEMFRMILLCTEMLWAN